MPDHDYIAIHGSLLQSKYGVYIIHVLHQSAGAFYYIGQTGDAKVISARSSFYRLAAHLGYHKSTQNQVYEALKKKTGISDRYELEKWLSQAEIRMYFFKVEDFVPMIKTDENNEKHHTKRRKTLALETALLETGKRKGKILLNATGKSYKDYQGSMDKAEQIWNMLETKS